MYSERMGGGFERQGMQVDDRKLKDIQTKRRL
jgi:hypothetical protein